MVTNGIMSALNRTKSITWVQSREQGVPLHHAREFCLLNTVIPVIDMGYSLTIVLLLWEASTVAFHEDARKGPRG